MRFYVFIIGVVVGLLSRIELTAQQIHFHCTEVDTAGNIHFSWSSSGFSLHLDTTYQYEIYGCSTSKTGTYTLLGTTTDLTTTNFSHIGANGGTKQWFYVIKAVPIPPATGTEYVSDTIGSILFVISGNGEIAKLEWCRPTNPPLASQAEKYTIYRQRNGIWTILANTDTTFFADTNHICGDTLRYQIRLYDTLGNCESKSRIQSHFFLDGTAPTTPQLDSVSINPVTGKTELGWNRSMDSDVFGYIVYIFNLKDSIWDVLDTVFGATTTFYTDNLYDANDTVRRYRIAAIDTCRNASPVGAAHNTILLNTSIPKCECAITLSWNPYIGMPDSLTNYRILASINGGAFVLIDSVLSNKQTYTHRGLADGKYVYIVQAYNSRNGYSGTSAKTEVNFSCKISTGNVWLRYVSVVNNQDIEIVAFVEDTTDYVSLFLYKSDDDKLTFSKIDAKTKINGVENYTFIDNNVDVQQRTYHYLVAIIDECDTIFAYSDTANNIVLDVKNISGDSTAIVWQPYYGFDSRLDSYDVLRRVQIDPLFQFVKKVPPTQLYYSESVWNVASGGGKFYYQVSANEDNTNPYGFQDKSYSNIVEIMKEPITYIPNIFYPNSLIAENRVFKPVNSYVDAEEYVFSIYDRWGSLIFTTNDINAGWDGATNGKPAELGVYAYILTYRLDKKTMFKKQGHVTLIR